MNSPGAQEKRTGLLDLPPDLLHIICCHLLPGHKKALGSLAVSCKALLDLAQHELFHRISVEDSDCDERPPDFGTVKPSTWRHIRYLSFSLSPFKQINASPSADVTQEHTIKFPSANSESRETAVIQARKAWRGWLDLLVNVIDLDISLYPKGLQDITDPISKRQWMHCSDFIQECRIRWSSLAKIILHIDLDLVQPNTPWPSVNWPTIFKPFEGFELMTTIWSGRTCCIDWECPLSSLPASATRELGLVNVRGSDVLSLGTTANLTRLDLCGVDFESIYEVLSRFSHTLVDLTLDDDSIEDTHSFQHLRLKPSSRPRIRMSKLATLWSNEVYLATLSHILDAISLPQTCEVTVIGTSTWHLIRTTEVPMVDLWLFSESISRLGVVFSVHLRWSPTSPCARYALQLGLLRNAIVRTGGQLKVELVHLHAGTTVSRRFDTLETLSTLAQENLLDHLNGLSLALNEIDQPRGKDSAPPMEPLRLSSVGRLSLSARDSSSGQTAANLDCILSKVTFPALAYLDVRIYLLKESEFTLLMKRLEVYLSSFPKLKSVSVTDKISAGNSARKPPLASLIIRQAALASLKRICESMNIECT